MWRKGGGKLGGLKVKSRVMSPASAIPKDLKRQTLAELEAAPEEDFDFVREAMLHARKLRLLDEISEGAERERSEGKWESLPERLASVRAKLRGL